MNRPQVFAPRTVFWLILVGGLSFAAAGYFMIFGDGEVGVTASANAFSRSAIGHRAVVEMLRRLDVPVVVSRHDSAAKASTALLVVAEPDLDSHEPETRELLAANSILLVLPKWRGRRASGRRSWIESVDAVPRNTVERVLRLVSPQGRILRPTGTPSWRGGPTGLTPVIADPQLIERAGGLTPLVETNQGILLGRVMHGEKSVLLLSDPDLLANHGLGKGDNARLVHWLFETHRRGGAVVFDETTHGFARPPILWRKLFEFPFVVTTLLILLTVAALFSAASVRFGQILPARPSLKSGKATLIDSTVGLLRYGGHGRELLAHYRDTILRDATRTLGAPRNLDSDALVEWVDRIGESRGVQQRFRALDEEVRGLVDASRFEKRHLVQTAQRLFRWKQEITHGS